MIRSSFTHAGLVVLVLALLQACCTPEETRPARSDTRDGDGEEARSGPSRSEMFFPTGERSSSSLRLQQEIPPEIRVGESFTQTLTVTNISSNNLDNVVLRQHLSPNFKPDPETGLEVRDGSAEWRLGSLKAGESKTLKVTGTVTEPGDLMQCSRVTFEPALCATAKVVLAKLDLQVTAPSEVLSCEPLVFDVIARNTGTARLEGVRIEHRFPEGLMTEDGKAAVQFDPGALEPGESVQFKVKAAPARKGEYEAKAVASAGNVKAEASSRTIVRDPVLSIEKSAEPDRSTGALAHLEITVKNIGDAPSHETVVREALPSGTEVSRISEGGRFSEGVAEWRLGTLAAGESRKLELAYTSRDVGPVDCITQAQGHCARPVMARATTVFKGVPAVLLEVVDDSDPVGVGEKVTYTITVTNQGSAPLTNVRVACGIDESVEFGKSEGETLVRESRGKALEFMPVSTLEPKAKAQWKVEARPTEQADSRFRVTLRSDQIERVVEESESTHFYIVE